MVITAIVFALLALSALLNNTVIMIVILIIAIPVSMALTSESAPKQYQTTIMGMFYFTLTLSGYLSGEIVTLSPIQTHAAHLYSAFFAEIALATLLLTALMYFLQERLAT